MTTGSWRHLCRAIIAAAPDDQTSLIGRQLNVHGVAGGITHTPSQVTTGASSVLGKQHVCGVVSREVVARFPRFDRPG
jgi:hypothetical protein